MDLNLKRITAVAGSAAVFATPLMAIGPAQAAERDFHYGGARIDYEVVKDDGRFEVDVDIDGKRNDRWRVTLWHDGKRYHQQVHRGDVDIEKRRSGTTGQDVFTMRVKKIGGPPAVTRTITLG